MRVACSRSVRNARDVRDRILLALSAALLFGGLAVWAVLGRGADGDDDRRRYAEAMRPEPPIGVDLHPADPRAAAPAEACHRAGLGDVPLRILFERDHQAVIGLAVPARQALEVWTALYGVSRETHLYPVILGDGLSLAALADGTRHTSTSVESTLRRADALDLDAWLASQPAPAPGEPIRVAPHAERFASVLDPSLRIPLHEIAIALLPITRGADAPAWLAFGNWRGCPEPAVHVAVLRRLETLVHADLVAITSDRIELRVSTPPTDQAERDRVAELLARWDPSAFAADRATIAAWSGTLVTSRSWSLSFARPR